jgi:L-ascorbate metabolism protein UlaG (beta-lactamase superfamily)
MLRTRRNFLKWSAASTGALLGAATWWTATSQRRAARYLRVLYADAKRSIQPRTARPDPGQWSDNQITIAWLGHASVLINFYGLTILTDPALGSRVGISLGLGTAGPKRFVAPGLSVKELPPIDVLLLSHAHMDHMDLPTLRRLRSKPFTVTAKLTADVLKGSGLQKITEMGWNEQTRFQNGKGDLVIEAVEVKHWGKRWPSELARGYNGYVLRREGKTLLFGGDTARTPLFRELRSRGPFQVALMPIGAYQPWIRNHCTPEEAVDMANAAGAQYLVPIHHRTFRLSEEPMNEPIERFEQALSKESERLALRHVGETFVCPA